MHTRLLSTVVLMTVAVVAAAGGATVSPGDRISGFLGDGDSDSLAFYVGSPSSLDVKAKLDKGLGVAFVVVGPDLGEINSAGAVARGLSRKPAIKRLALTQVGTYRLVIEQATGAGAYRLRLKLGKHSPRDIDMTGTPPSSSAARFAASEVTFDPAGTPLAASNIQAAVEEVADVGAAALALAETNELAVVTNSLDIAANAAAIAANAAAVLGVAGDVAALPDLSPDVADLQGRVDALETAPPVAQGLRVLFKDSDILLTAVRENIPSQGGDLWIVDSAQIATVSIAADALSETVLIRTTVQFRPVPSTVSANGATVGVWARIDGEDVRATDSGAKEGATRLDLVTVHPDVLDAMGVPGSLRDDRSFEYTFDVVHHISAAQAAAGFDVSVLAGLSIRENDEDGLLGATLTVESVVILGE